MVRERARSNQSPEEWISGDLTAVVDLHHVRVIKPGCQESFPAESLELFLADREQKFDRDFAIEHPLDSTRVSSILEGTLHRSIVILGYRLENWVLNFPSSRFRSESVSTESFSVGAGVSVGVTWTSLRPFKASSRATVTLSLYMLSFK